MSATEEKKQEHTEAEVGGKKTTLEDLQEDDDFEEFEDGEAIVSCLLAESP